MDEKELIVFIDSGDTIIDEGTEIRDENGIVIKADLIPGVYEMLKTLYERGYTLALVADGLAQSFVNMFTQNGIYNFFTTLIYSEPIRAEKPSPRMYKAAVGALDLSEEDYGRIVMVGNNLERDIKGANNLGITSIFLSWSPRYTNKPADKSEIPNFTISEPLELIDLVERLNTELVNKKRKKQAS